MAIWMVAIEIVKLFSVCLSAKLMFSTILTDPLHQYIQEW